MLVFVSVVVAIKSHYYFFKVECANMDITEVTSSYIVAVPQGAKGHNERCTVSFYDSFRQTNVPLDGTVLHCTQSFR